MKKRLGYTGAVPNGPALIVEILPERFTLTVVSSPFLCHMGYVDNDHTELLLLFIAEHGRRVLEKSSVMY